MKVCDFSIKHPIIITMILIVLVVFDFYSVSLMPKEFMTDISIPQANVLTLYPGASAEDIESEVTSVMENAFVTLPHFKNVSSSSSNSMSIITVTYADGIDPYEQLVELRNRITEIKASLPEGIEDPYCFVGGVTMLPIFTFSVQAGNDTARTTDYIKNELTPRLTRIDGVSQISIDGGKELQLNVKLKTEELASKGISVSTVYQVLNYANVNVPLGTAVHNEKSIQVRYEGSFSSIEDIRLLPVGNANEKIIRLSDVADVYLGYPKEESWITNGNLPIICVKVTKRTDGDTIKIIEKVKKVLAEEEKKSNGAVSFKIVSDDSRAVNASLKTVIKSGVMGVIYAVLIILLFMADWRATLTIGLSIPLCILFTLIGLKVFGISINLMSLSGLVISLGMVVDGSTVMIDQIYRWYKRRDSKGKTVYTVNESIYKGWDEVASSILASSATTIVVFIPIALLSGLIGMILHAVAVTIIMAIFASFLVAVIIVPYFLKLVLSPNGAKPETEKRKFDLFLEKVETKYKTFISWALTHRKTIIFSSIALLAFSGFLAFRMGLAFIPSTDSGDFYVYVEFPTGTKAVETKEKMDLAKKLLFDAVPEIDNCVFTIGKPEQILKLSDTPEKASVHVLLVPVSERKRDVHDIILQVQELIASSLPDAKVTTENGGFDKLVAYASNGGGYGLTLICEDMDLLYRTALDLQEFLEKDSEVVTTSLSSDFDTSTLVIDMSSEYLSSLGITSYEAGITSAILFQGVDAGRYKERGMKDGYKIRLFSDIKDGDISRDTIANIHIITQRGKKVSFANLSDVTLEKNISQINHDDRAKTITVSATLISENTAGVAGRVNEYLKAHPLPGGVESKSGGIMALIGDMITPMVTALLIAIFLVYTVMVIQFEDLKQPLLIMISIPFCFIGVVLGLMMFGSTMNLLAMMGLISLAGIVVNNGIILVDFTNQLMKEKREVLAKEKGFIDKDGLPQVSLTDDEEKVLLRECIVEGSSSRIKPILITTLTTLLGCIPMAVSSGEGAEIYAPMGQAIAGGLLTSTLITLIIIPVLYYISKRQDTKRKERIDRAIKKVKTVKRKVTGKK